MNQRFNLFYAGYSVNAPSLYFSQLLLPKQYGSDAGERAREELEKFTQALRAKFPEQNTHLVTAESIANSFELQPSPLPSTPENYFEWLSEYVELFEKTFPMSRIDHYYFLFGRKLSELMSNLRLASCCLDLEERVDHMLNLSRTTEKCIRDNEFILFKLIAPAALLSSEPRQNFFNVLYKRINAQFEPFRGVAVPDLERPAKKKLHADLHNYEQEVAKGFQECVSMLRELGV